MSTPVLAAVLATTVRLLASHASYADVPPLGFSGGFEEGSCHACHFHSEPNAPGGRLTIEGIPAKFAAGERYTLTITLTRPEMKRAGFQIAARFKDKTQAGTITPGAGEGERVVVRTDSGVQYAAQRKAGSIVEAGDTVKWTIEWTAPVRGGPVIFHVAANAADGNDSADGDFVYTATAESPPSP